MHAIVRLSGRWRACAFSSVPAGLSQFIMLRASTWQSADARTRYTLRTQHRSAVALCVDFVVVIFFWPSEERCIGTPTAAVPTEQNAIDSRPS
ncbi:unnamed protein product [Trichogramma brassicae]|uniref:Uncharacterized protein n=1 Tax=Trichogramma brassicae TaxID=86971 RepID=A0A6H5II80_9HYME|nr:unnamed protein product [Trichogramma brassicae]